MVDVQRNSHAHTTSHVQITDGLNTMERYNIPKPATTQQTRLMEKKTSSKKWKYGRNPFFTCLLGTPLGFSSLFKAI